MLYLCTRKQETRNFLGLLIQIGIWCNGNTADSGPAFPGSSPGIPTRTLNEKSSSVFLCPHFKCTRYYIYLETTNLFPNLT